MKRILILIHVLFCGYICPLLAEDTGAVRYQDSILKVADTLPATLVRLTYLRDMAYKHQYAPYNMTFSTRLYEEARRQKNAFYENMGAYYLAACYDKKHDPDSLSYWVDVLKDFVPQVGTYDYYLEQKAAISRALASKRQIEKAVQAIQRKNMFLSNMSHEVRTPLNAIVGFSAVLTDEDESFDDESRREFSEIIKVNSFQLLKLINDILDFSDFENDNITFNIRTHDAVKLCNEVVETVMASRKLEVEMRFDTDLSVLMLDTDDARLRQVLINLLVNATKFTEQGSIVLELKMADAGTALFSVTDTGCGIPPEKQHLIFERFEKLNDFVQGSGLGLSICQLIVKYMNGKLWVDSGYTRGARFCFTHPLKYNPALHGGTAQ